MGGDRNTASPHAVPPPKLTHWPPPSAKWLKRAGRAGSAMPRGGRAECAVAVGLGPPPSSTTSRPPAPANGLALRAPPGRMEATSGGREAETGPPSPNPVSVLGCASSAARWRSNAAPAGSCRPHTGHAASTARGGARRGGVGAARVRGAGGDAHSSESRVEVDGCAPVSPSFSLGGLEKGWSVGARRPAPRRTMPRGARPLPHALAR